MNIVNGEHMREEDFDKIEAGQLGSSQETPYLLAPTDWHENGVPYGAWCKCSNCNTVGRSTYGFDFYARDPGDKLECEPCAIRKAIATSEEAKKMKETSNG